MAFGEGEPEGEVVIKGIDESCENMGKKLGLIHLEVGVEIFPFRHWNCNSDRASTGGASLGERGGTRILRPQSLGFGAHSILPHSLET
jgi:hypothetical protein